MRLETLLLMVKLLKFKGNVYYYDLGIIVE